MVAACTQGAGNITWHRKDIPALCQGMHSGIKRATAAGGFYNHNSIGQATNQPVALQKVAWVWLGAFGVFADDRPTLVNNPLAKRPVSHGVEPVQAVAKHRNSCATAIQAGPVGGGIDTQRQATHNDHASLGKLPGKAAGYLAAIAGGLAGAHNRDAWLTATG